MKRQLSFVFSMGLALGATVQAQDAHWLAGIVTGTQWQASGEGESIIVPWLAYENHWLKLSPTEVQTYAPLGVVWVSAGVDIDYGADGNWRQKIMTKLALTAPAGPVKSYVQVKHRSFNETSGLLLTEGITVSLPFADGRLGVLETGVAISQMSANWQTAESTDPWQNAIAVSAGYGVRKGSWQAGMQISLAFNKGESGQIWLQIGRSW